MNTTQRSTAELEAAILAGEEITPEQLAAAKTSEDAAARIGQLTAQRAEEKEKQVMRAKAEELAAFIIRDFNEFMEDSTFADVKTCLIDAAEAYASRFEVHNRELSRIRGRIADVQRFEGASINIYSEPEGAVRCGNHSTSLMPEWETPLRHIFDDAIIKARNRKKMVLAA